MNLSNLVKFRGKAFHLRPTPVVVNADGRSRRESDDQWFLQDILDKPNRLVLFRPSSGHRIELQSDNVREYRSPHYIALRCQLVVNGNEVLIEPIFGQSPTPPVGVSLESLISQVRDAPLLSRPDFAKSLRGTPVYVKGVLASLQDIGTGKVQVGIVAGHLDVFFPVEISKYPELAIVKSGTPATVRGRVATLEGTIWLEDAELELNSNAPPVA